MNKINCPIFKFHGEVVKENKKITQKLFQSEATYEVNLEKTPLHTFTWRKIHRIVHYNVHNCII